MRHLSWLVTLATLIFVSLVADANELRWGADTESGAPFSFKDPGNPDQIVGFEADIVAALARHLKRTPRHVQNQWDGLIQGLNRGDYDLVINGLEITEDRRQAVLFSRPYYVTSETLTVRRDDYSIRSLADTNQKRVGTLDGSLALRILQADAPMAEAVVYDEEVHAYNDLAEGRLDAVLLDEPIALYYARPDSRLKSLSEPIGRLEYGIAVRLNDQALLAEVNQALTSMIDSGELRSILERWGLWNQLTAREWRQTSEPRSDATAYQSFLRQSGQERDWRARLTLYFSLLPLLAKGAGLTLGISIVAMLLAIAVGLVVALARLYGNRSAAFLALSFVEIFRGTPLLIQLYLIFYGLPNLGIRLDPFWAAVIGLGLNYGACEAENYRAGILSVPRSQMDAARALGMSRHQSLRHIILPQAIRLVIPPVTNDFIALLKDSSLVSVITMVELTTIYGQLASTYFDYLGIGILVAAIYFAIGLPFVRLSRVWEARLVQDRRVRPKGARSPLNS